MTRVVVAAATLAAVAAGPAAAQGYRIRLDARGQSVSYQGLAADSIRRTDIVTTPDGAFQTPDGYALRCTGETWCYYYRPGPKLVGIPVAATADFVVWGLGIRGLSLKGSARFITDAGDDDAWPGAEPNAQLLEGYAEYDATWLVVRGGRLLQTSRLQPIGYDGGWARGRWKSANLEGTAYGGWGLGQAAVVPITSPVLNPLDEWRPMSRQVVAGGEVAWMPGPVDLRAEYRREVDTDWKYFVSERASVSFTGRPVQSLLVNGGVDYNLDYAQLGNADATVTWLGKGWSVAAGGRHYQPYFNLWTLWGAFSPVPYNAIQASGTVRPIHWLDLRARGERYWYDNTAASSALVTTFEDDGWRASVGATVTPADGWTLDGAYLMEVGPGANSGYWDLSATWQPQATLQLRAYGGRLYRPLELRYWDATGTWVGGRATWEFARQMQVFADAQYFADERARPDPAATDWDQLRLRGGITVTFGSNPDRRTSTLPPARRSLP